MPTVRGAATTVVGDAHPAGRLAACPGRRHAGRPAPVAAGPRRAPARRPDRAGHPGRHPRLGAPRVRRPRHGRPARPRGARRRGRGHRAGRPGRASRRLFGPDLPPAVLDAALAALRARALAWDAVDPDTSGTEWAGIALVPAVRDVVSRFPGGLGRPAAGVGRVVRPAGAARRASTPDERRVLETLAAGPPIGRSRGADPANPVSRLLARGLLVRVDPETVELPRQVGLALRGDRPLGALALGPPDLATVDRGVGTVDGTAAGAALRALRQVEQLVAFWATTPPPVLRSGGLGVRELRRAAREVDADETHGRAARRDRRGGGPGRGERRRRARVGADHRGRRLGGRGPGAALGRAGPRLARPAAAARARRHPGRRRAADRRAVRRPAPAAGPPGPAPGARRARRAAAGNGRRATSEALADLLAWRAPRRGGRLRDEVVRWVLAEATVLGVVALDALSTPGRALLDRAGARRLRPARCAARARRPRAAAGRPDRGRAGPAGARAGRRAGPRGRGRVGGRGDRLPVHRGDRAPGAGRRADRCRAARAVRDALRDPGARRA